MAARKEFCVDDLWSCNGDMMGEAVVGEPKWHSALPATRTHSSCVTFPLFSRLEGDVYAVERFMRAQNFYCNLHTQPPHLPVLQHPTFTLPMLPHPQPPIPPPLTSQQHSSRANAGHRQCPAAALHFPHPRTPPPCT